MNRLHLFRAGRRRDMHGIDVAFSEADLAGIASTYDAALHEAPIVVGHPTTDAPAYGWVGSLAADGAELYGETQQVDPAFAEQVTAGRYKKLSAAFYLPGSPNHPVRKAGGEPQFPYLRHVGFLGATPPALPGLDAVQFASEADDEHVAVMEVAFAEDGAPLWSVRRVLQLLRRLREHIASESGAEVAERVLPAHDLDFTMEDLAIEQGRQIERERQREQAALTEPAFSEPTPDPMPTEQKQTELDERERRLAEREAAIAAQETERRRAEHVAFAEELADQARILPRQAGVVTAVLDRLAGLAPDDQTVQFAEGEDPVAADEALRRLLQELPQQVEYAEQSAPRAADEGTVAYAAPAGYAVDAASLAVHQKALAYQRQHSVDYVTAVSAVS